MTYRRTHVGTAALLFTLACSSQVEIGHGGGGGKDGKGGSGATTAGSSTDGGADPTPEGGSDGEGGSSTAGRPASGGTSGATGTAGTGLVGGPIPNDDGPQAMTDKLDLLLAVDNSISMAEKQKLFAKTMPELVLLAGLVVDIVI